MFKIVTLSLVALFLVVSAIAACSRLPSLENRTISTTFLDTDDTRLGKAIAPRVASHPGMSGVYPLSDARDAFSARVLLARAAERSLDVQYYIWHNDLSGMLLFDALRDAAERGVRVRLLLDDNNTAGLDRTLAALDAHSNIEVRLFNPFVIRKLRWIGYLTDFSRLNRRMHNKSFTADNQATIIGGRNVGDEYFGATEGNVYVDLDVMAVGPVVKEVSKDFDRYWESASSYPVDRLLPPAEPAVIADFAAAVTSRVREDPAAIAYLSAVRESPFVRQLVDGRLALEWAPTRMVSDDPAKGLGEESPAAFAPEEKLRQVLGRPASAVDLVSAYFVPAGAGTAALVAMAQRGVRVRILTNSLEATDVAVVHAGYTKRRKALLTAGITLYELRRLSPRADVDRHDALGSMGSSDSSLHAKTFSADGSRVYIGSFNFDPRSARLNTELGFVIESPVLAQRIQAAFDNRIPARSYEVHLSDNGQLYWTERSQGKLVRHDTEPGTSFWQRAGVWFLSLWPIEWML